MLDPLSITVGVIIGGMAVLTYFYETVGLRKEAVSTEECPSCPICNGEMTKKVNGRTGTYFYGCLNYPQCNGNRGCEHV